jgi:ribonuclease Z
VTPLLHPVLVNDRFGDPALYVELLFRKRALLFDLGDLAALGPRKILRLSEIYVTHAHLDHFVGFDRVLRVLLPRDKTLRLYGPAGFLDRVEHKLAGYTWNLTNRYATDLVFQVTEVGAPDQALSATFRLRNGFRREAEGASEIVAGTLFRDESLEVSARILDHRIPCLAFAVRERAHVNIWKSRLEALGLPVGPWLDELKRAVLQGEPEDRAFRVWWRRDGQIEERFLPLGRLKREIIKIVPGQKIAYVADVKYTQANARKIVDLAQGADTLFIEACFAREDTLRGAERYHLTTAQAGQLARQAAVRRLEPFHFSTRYTGEERRLLEEVRTAFRATPP